MTLVLEKVSLSKTLEPDVYAMLITLFPTIIAPALEIIDSGRITKLVCQKSKRFFYLVKDPGSSSTTSGSNNQQNNNQTNNQRKIEVMINDDSQNTHIIYGDFCFSYFFAKECLNESGSAPLSKYMLAVKIAEALSNT